MIEVKLRYNYLPPGSDYDRYRPRVPRQDTLRYVRLQRTHYLYLRLRFIF